MILQATQRIDGPGCFPRSCEGLWGMWGVNVPDVQGLWWRATAFVVPHSPSTRVHLRLILRFAWSRSSSLPPPSEGAFSAAATIALKYSSVRGLTTGRTLSERRDCWSRSFSKVVFSHFFPQVVHYFEGISTTRGSQVGFAERCAIEITWGRRYISGRVGCHRGKSIADWREAENRARFSAERKVPSGAWQPYSSTTNWESLDRHWYIFGSDVKLFENLSTSRWLEQQLLLSS